MKTAIFVLALTAALATPLFPAAAQQPSDDPVAACRAAHAADPESRIACLEAAIGRMRGQVQQAEQQVEAAQQQVEQAQQQAAAAQQQAAATPSRPGWSIPGFRAAERAAEPEQVRVQITRVRYGGDGYGFFTTADGQVWRETVAAPARRRLESDEAPYEAVIHRGFMGGFRMNVDGIRWEYKVEPLN